MKNQQEKNIKEAKQDELSAQKEFDSNRELTHPNPKKKQHSMDDYRKKPKNNISNEISMPSDEQQYDEKGDN